MKRRGDRGLLLPFSMPSSIISFFSPSKIHHLCALDVACSSCVRAERKLSKKCNKEISAGSAFESLPSFFTNYGKKLNLRDRERERETDFGAKKRREEETNEMYINLNSFGKQIKVGMITRN
jgi:hypothetical protein